jgi:hypothetical protein
MLNPSPWVNKSRAQGLSEKVWDQISTKTVLYCCMEVELYELDYFYSAQISQNEEFKKAGKCLKKSVNLIPFTAYRPKLIF